MSLISSDIELPSVTPNLELDKHVEFLTKYGTVKDDYEYCVTEFLRMSGMYWGLTSLDLISHLDVLPKEQVLLFIRECYDECSGGFSPAISHDPHLLYTLSAIQILAMYDELDKFETDKICDFISTLQQSDGSFYGDKWGEVDIRFTFCAVAALTILKRIDVINVKSAVDFVLSCQNFDGGFGSKPGSESHAGLIYCALGTLSILHEVDRIDGDLLGWWLCERQLKSGGFNGRPEKLPDVCYSWWVLASLTILGRSHWINRESLSKFILCCQETCSGGFSDRPSDMPDPFHTLFGLAALSLLNHSPKIKDIHPVFCMSYNVISKLGIDVQILKTA